MCGIIAVVLADPDARACQLLYDGLTITFENEDGQRMPFTGSNAAVIDDISAYG